MLYCKLNKVYILESLRKDDSNIYSGKTLAEDLKLRLLKDNKYTVQYINFQSKKELDKALDRIEKSTKFKGEFPIIHFSVHGSREGIEINPSKESLTWEDIYSLLIPINISTRLNLMVNFSACYGQFLYKIYNPKKRAVFLLSIGPKKKIVPSKLYDFYLEYYSTLLETKEIIKAIESKGTLKDDFLSIFDYQYFLYYIDEALKTFEKKRMKKRLTQETNKLIRKGFVDPANKSKFISEKSIEFKEIMLLHLSDTFIHHFMVDLYPENAERFKIDKHQLPGEHNR